MNRTRRADEACYVFRVRFRLDAPGVETEPETFETVVRYPAAEPGDDEGRWRFFEEWLWRGELTDAARFREVMETWLSVPVDRVSFSELVVSEAYLEAWTDAVAAELDRYNADSVREVRHNHLGSSIRVRGRD
ncbi:LWR-salt protein [Salinigranum halophilum]|uniref:LWR-salt protein n=1 Tax=Salinigranum halophilum TaxID=2565931 RepID=UPI0010A7C592|nr:LWR-salt protein [Salinigranum halophilum]